MADDPRVTADPRGMPPKRISGEGDFPGKSRIFARGHTFGTTRASTKDGIFPSHPQKCPKGPHSPERAHTVQRTVAILGRQACIPRPPGPLPKGPRRGRRSASEGVAKSHIPQGVHRGHDPQCPEWMTRAIRPMPCPIQASIGKIQR